MYIIKFLTDINKIYIQFIGLVDLLNNKITT